MSAIFGIIYLDGRTVNAADVTRMDTALAHYGPDDVGIWREGCVALGHRMLWNTPESLHEKLPLRNASGTITLTADARIDNRDELLPVLGLAADAPDSAVILAAYEKWGEDCAEHLLGDFAIALWDGGKQALFCARDHFGIQPFYYYHAPGKVFAFASSINALLALPDVPRELNEPMVATFLVATTGITTDFTSTIFQAIQRPDIAAVLVVNRAGLRMRRYWSLDPQRELRLKSDDEYAEGFLEVFTKAIDCRLRSAYPVAAELSGGLDSSSITVIARELLANAKRGPLHTIYAQSGSPLTNERDYAQAVIDQGGLIHHDVRAWSPLHDFSTRWYPDGLMHSFILNSVDIYQTMRDQGIRTLLSGTDGDTTVSYGYDYLAELAHHDDWPTFAAEANAVANRLGKKVDNFNRVYAVPRLNGLAKRRQMLPFVRAAEGMHRHLGYDRRTLYLSWGIKQALPESALRRWRQLRGQPEPVRKVWWQYYNATMNADFVQRIGLEASLRKIDEAPQPTTERAAHYKYFMNSTHQAGFEEVDRLLAHYQLELRYPFYDRRLMEYCLSLPPQQKLREGWDRMVLRQAMKERLPEKVRWRAVKTDFTTDFTEAMLEQERAELEAAVTDTAVIEPYIDAARLRQAFERYVEGRPNGTRPVKWDAFALWRAAMLSIWLRYLETSQADS